jgi:hypothetical protein
MKSKSFTYIIYLFYISNNIKKSYRTNHNNSKEWIIFFYTIASKDISTVKMRISKAYLIVEKIEGQCVE